MSAATVVLCREDDEARLRGTLNYLESKFVSFERPESFLIDPNRTTPEGEEQWRDIKRRFASLRGKIVIRLAAVDLIKEPNALDGILDDWDSLLTRQEEHLREQSTAEMDLITVVIALRGAWKPEHRAQLERLSDMQFDGSQLTSRCFLMSEELELSTTEPIFAPDVWPEYVAGLISHFRRKRDASAKHIAGTSTGLYAWRALQIKGRLKQDFIDDGVQESTKRLNAKLFPSNTLAFGESDNSMAGEPPEGLSPLKNPLNNVDWRSVPSFGSFAESISSNALSNWISERKPGWEARFAEARRLMRNEVNELIRHWRLEAAKPALVSITEKINQGSSAARELESIEIAATKSADADKLEASIQARLIEHQAAADHSPSLNTASMIAVIVSSALIFVASLLFINTARLLGLSVSIAAVNLVVVISGIVLGCFAGLAMLSILTSKSGTRSLDFISKQVKSVLDLRAEAKWLCTALWWYGKRWEQLASSLALKNLTSARINAFVGAAKAPVSWDTSAHQNSPSSILVHTIELEPPKNDAILRDVTERALDQYWDALSGDWQRVLKLTERGFFSQNAISNLLIRQSKWLAEFINERAIKYSIQDLQRVLETGGNLPSQPKTDGPIHDIFVNRATMLSVNTDQGSVNNMAVARRGFGAWIDSLLGGTSNYEELEDDDLPDDVIAYIFSEVKINMHDHQSGRLVFTLED